MLLENIKEALQSISANKMRSFLTMLGIIIGITAVITITTIGASIRSTLNATMNSLGGNTIYVYVEAIWPDDLDDEEWETWEYPSMDEEDYITPSMMDELEETYPDEVAGYLANTWLADGQIYENSDTYANVYVEGVTDSQLDYTKLNLVRGRNITKQDMAEEKRVCLVSDLMVNYYFGEENPIGQQIEVETSEGDSWKFTIVGVYEYDVAIFGQDTSVAEKDRQTFVYIPVTTANAMSSEEIYGYEYVTILLQVGADATLAEEEINTYFEDVYSANEDWTIWSYNSSADLETIDTVINVITIAISVITAISLVVGGIGVMNIMLVSITERTKEIGIRKALGAKNRTIRQQFLIESVVLCVIGGVIGILLGLLFGFLLGRVAMMLINTYYADFSSYIVLNVRPSGIAIILSVGFSMLIGIFFGSYPAKKAAKMEVIDALRYE
ncbi:MAG: ABC transporter permease [Clostridiales bacterium]|nr:ABC transporter permease [Clostridiales bacterium]